MHTKDQIPSFCSKQEYGGLKNMTAKNIKNLAHLSTAFDASFEKKECLTVDGRTLNFREFSDTVTNYSKKFKTLGLQKGDKIGILLFNSIEYLTLMYAAMYAGFVPVNINARYKAKELNYVLHDSGCKVLFTSSDSDEITNFTDLISSVYNSPEGQPKSLNEVYIIGGAKDGRFRDFKDFEDINIDMKIFEDPIGEGDDPAFIMYTSGTTANPKGCPLSHSSLIYVANSMIDRWKMTENDVFWDPLPMFHMSSILPFMACTISKSTFLSTIHFNVDSSIRTLIEKDVSIAFPAFPAVMVALINHKDFLPENLKKLRLINNVAPIETLRSFQNKVPQASLVSAYGLTEVGGVTSFGSPDDSLECRLSNCGKPWPGAEIRILDPETNEVLKREEKGLIEIRGPHVFNGYLNDKKATENALSSDKWFSTGDIGSYTEDGYIQFHGRLKDMLKVGGENVAALEIEAYFDSHEEVLISQVVGIDDDHLGEVPALFVEKKSNSDVSKEELIEFCKGQISNFKIPRYIVFVDKWPMSSTKVQKFKLKDLDLGEKVFGK